MSLLMIFRLCIVFSVIFEFGSVGVDLVFPSLISTELAAAAEKDFDYGFMERHLYIFLATGLTWMVLALAGVIGAFFLKRWGRTISLYATLAGMLFYPFMGSMASSGISTSLAEASSMLWGAALALAYFSPLSECFESAKQIQSQMST